MYDDYFLVLNDFHLMLVMSYLLLDDDPFKWNLKTKRRKEKNFTSSVHFLNNHKLCTRSISSKRNNNCSSFAKPALV